jgi:alpha-D-ribose 1-methylphosphonate 5-triphosphate synthase subunit PhnL
MIEVPELSKSFTLHTQGGTVIEVMRGAALSVHRANAWR